jgi:hypothetical protein
MVVANYTDWMISIGAKYLTRALTAKQVHLFLEGSDFIKKKRNGDLSGFVLSFAVFHHLKLNCRIKTGSLG